MQPHTGQHRLAILALPGFVPFDISIPYQMFPMVALADGHGPYATFFCGPQPTAAGGGFTITDIEPLERIRQADTLIVPGIDDALAYDDAQVLEHVRAAADAGVRLASICTGACVLAAAGLLDGLAATTHWELAGPLAARYPAITMTPDVLFVDNGHILTSAGLASGLDLCLHLIRKDCGVAAAERAADMFVMPLEREAGHSQRIRRAEPQGADPLARLQLWLVENLHRELTLDDLARRACVSARTLHRRFREQTGDAPMAWLARARVRRAQALLESSSMTVEEIATATGFGTATALRDGFRRHAGTTPTGWRKTYGG